MSTTDVTTILGVPTILDKDFVTEKNIKSDPCPESQSSGPLPNTIGVLDLQPAVKSEPAQSESEILHTHALDCELHMQITNIISLRQDHSPPDTAEYSTDSTIMGGALTPQAHLLNSPTNTNGDFTWDSNESITTQDLLLPSPSVPQDVTENTRQTCLLVVTNISPIETLGTPTVLQDVTPASSHVSQDVTDNTKQSISQDVTGDSPLLVHPQDETRTDPSAIWNSGIEPIINILPENDVDSHDIVSTMNMLSEDTTNADVTVLASSGTVTSSYLNTG